MCPTCGKAFRVRANYYKHRKIHERSAADQTQQIDHQQELIQPARNQTENEAVMSVDSTNSALTVPQQSGLLENFTVNSLSNLENKWDSF